MEQSHSPLRKRALLLVHRIPFPPDKGDKIRSWQLLKHLAARFDLSLGCFIDDPKDWAHTEYLSSLCASACFVPLNPKWAKLKSAIGLFTNQPLTYPYYASAQMRSWIETAKAEKPFDLAMGFSSSMAPYLKKQGLATHRIVDLVDADSDKWRQYAELKKLPMSLVYQREAKLLAREEAAISQWADVSFLVAEEEADFVRALPNADADKIDWWGNGVDIDYYSPDAAFTALENPAEIVFTGAMDYWANEQAVLWFIDNVWPSLRQHHPNLRIAIVGSKPQHKLMALNNSNGITVTGRVEDVRPFIAGAKLSIAPLQVARGIQNKVLEAMAMGKAVVATEQAAAGLEPAAKANIVIADNAAQQIKVITSLLSDSQSADELGKSARHIVASLYGWRAQLQRLDRHLARLDLLDF